VNLWKLEQAFLPRALPKAESRVAFCGNSGKLASPRPAGEAIDRFMQFRKQVLRTFFNSSPQDLGNGTQKASTLPVGSSGGPNERYRPSSGLHSAIS